MLEGALQRMTVHPDNPARYELVVEAPVGDSGRVEPRTLPLDPFTNKELQIEFNGLIICAACAARTRRSYGEGHCYRCFKRLARCDLCVVSPARCHYAQGTCREPEWGETFCMQPHLVYLANSSGPKVGITTDGGQFVRWLDQGATQGLVVARAATRHLAGVLEERLGRRVSDRTDWRALLHRDAAPVDLMALREALRAGEALPDGVRWLDDEAVVALQYPVLRYPRRLARLKLEDEGTVRGRLLGVKGQYLLFDHGVLNVRRHRSYHVRVTVSEGAELPDPAAESVPPHSQMELFS